MTDSDGSSRVPAPSALDRRLCALGMRFPELREASETYRVLLTVLREAPAPEVHPAISVGEAAGKLARGEPLLNGATFAFDLDSVLGLVLRLAEALEGRGVAKAAPVRKALERGRIPPERFLRRAAAGDSAFVRTLARSVAVDPALLYVLAQNALKPTLRAWNRRLAPLVLGLSWERGYCLVCGALATLAEFRGNGPSRHLRCGQCGADWGVRRLLCPFCGNEDPASMGFLHAGERMERTRVEVCDLCLGYLKVVTAFEPCAPDEVIVEDLATLPLDYAARARGYTSHAKVRWMRPG